MKIRRLGLYVLAVVPSLGTKIAHLKALERCANDGYRLAWFGSKERRSHWTGVLTSNTKKYRVNSYKLRELTLFRRTPRPSARRNRASEIGRKEWVCICHRTRNCIAALNDLVASQLEAPRNQRVAVRLDHRLVRLTDGEGRPRSLVGVVVLDDIAPLLAWGAPLAITAAAVTS